MEDQQPVDNGLFSGCLSAYGLDRLFSYIHGQRKYYSDLLASKNDGVRQTIYEITTQIFTISDSVVYNDQLIDFLTGEYETSQEMLVAAAKTKLLDRYAARYAGLEQISVYIDRPDMIDYGQFHKVTDEIRESDWYKKASEQYMPFWMAYESKDSRNSNMTWNLVLVRKMVLVGGDREAVIMIKIRNSYLDSRLVNPGYTTLIAIDDQPVAFSSSVSLYGTKPDVPIDYDDNNYSYEGKVMFQGKESMVRANMLKLSKSSNKPGVLPHRFAACEMRWAKRAAVSTVRWRIRYSAARS